MLLKLDDRYGILEVGESEDRTVEEDKAPGRWRDTLKSMVELKSLQGYAGDELDEVLDLLTDVAAPEERHEFAPPIDTPAVPLTAEGFPDYAQLADVFPEDDIVPAFVMIEAVEESRDDGGGANTRLIANDENDCVIIKEVCRCPRCTCAGSKGSCKGGNQHDGSQPEPPTELRSYAIIGGKQVPIPPVQRGEQRKMTLDIKKKKNKKAATTKTQTQSIQTYKFGHSSHEEECSEETGRRWQSTEVPSEASPRSRGGIHHLREWSSRRLHWQSEEEGEQRVCNDCATSVRRLEFGCIGKQSCR